MRQCTGTIRAAVFTLGLLLPLGACASGDLSDEDRELREERLESLERGADANNRERRQRVDEDPG